MQHGLRDFPDFAYRRASIDLSPVGQSEGTLLPMISGIAEFSVKRFKESFIVMAID